MTLRWHETIGTVSVATTEDLSLVQRAIEACADFHELLYGVPPRGGEAEQLRSEVPPGVRPEDHLFAVVSDQAGTPVGLLAALRHYPAPNEWILADLMLAPSLRSRGTGRRIYEAFEAWAQSHGATAILLVVQETNPGALRFWTRRGFTPYSRGPQKLGDREHTITRLRRDL